MALDFFAGCAGGCAGVIVGHPLDTVKVHLQTQNAKSPQYRGTLHCLQSLMKTEGARGVYRGMSSPLVGVAAINAIVFGVYGNVQRNLQNPDSLSSHLIAGAAAGFLQSFICSPMELAKSRLQVASSKMGPLDCLQGIYRKTGFRGVFRGLGVTIAREVPAFGSYFFTYELVTRLDAESNSAPVSTATMLLAGGLAGVVSWVAIYPIDVIKSRLQIDDGSYKNSWDCLRKSVKSEGYRFLYRGLSPTIIRAFPVNAATFGVVTWTMRVLNTDGESVWGRCADAVSSLQVPEAAPV